MLLSKRPACAVVGFVVFAWAAVALCRSDVLAGFKGDKVKPEAARRVECVLLDLDKTYRLASKNKEAIVSTTLEDADSMTVGRDADDAACVIIKPSKEGVFTLSITPAKGEKENLTVVVIKKK